MKPWFCLILAYSGVNHHSTKKGRAYIWSYFLCNTWYWSSSIMNYSIIVCTACALLTLMMMSNSLIVHCSCGLNTNLMKITYFFSDSDNWTTWASMTHGYWKCKNLSWKFSITIKNIKCPRRYVFWNLIPSSGEKVSQLDNIQTTQQSPGKAGKPQRILANFPVRRY